MRVLDTVPFICNRSELDSKKALLRKTQKDCERAEQDLLKLKGEIVNALKGESAFSPELLNDVIQGQEKRCEELREARRGAEEALKESQAQMELVGHQYDDLLKWSTAFEIASMSAKKVIVSRMIERVDVYRDYRLKLKLNLSLEQFLVNLDGIALPARLTTA